MVIVAVAMAPPEEEEASTGGFIFINHNAQRLSTIKDRSHRAAVNQHVQKLWLKNKKPKDQKIPRRPKSSKAPEGIPNLLTGSSETDSNDDAHSTQPTAPAQSKTTKQIRVRTTRSIKVRRPKNDEMVPYTPFNMLTHHYTDPFRMSAIPIDSVVLRALQYSRDTMLPCIYSMEVNTKTPPLGLTKACELLGQLAEDQCAMAAYLAATTTSMSAYFTESATSNASLELIREGLKYNQMSSSLLRNRITKSKENIEPRLLMIVLWLAASAISTGNLMAGKFHANALCFLVKQYGGLAKVDTFQRENILQFDVQFAMMWLQRPLFRPQEYAPSGIDMSWLNCPAIQKSSPESEVITYPPLNPSLMSPDLASTISEVRELQAVLTFTLQNTVPADSQIFRWMFTRKQAVQARLVEIYCDLTDSPTDLPPSTSTWAGGNQASTTTTTSSSKQQLQPPHLSKTEYHSLEPALCIATLHWITQLTNLSKHKLYVPSLLHLLAKLRTHLSTTEPNYFTFDIQSADNPTAPLRLWILYAGAMAEQELRSGLPPEKRELFASRFVLQMRWMGIRGPEECREVLEGLLFAERLHDDGFSEVAKQLGREEAETGFERWWRRMESRFGWMEVGDLPSWEGGESARESYGEPGVAP